jgi:predicted permease
MIFALQILAIFGLIACGWFARKSGRISATGTSEMARLATDIIYPALIFFSITRLQAHELQAHFWLPIWVMGIGLVGLGLGLIAVQFMKPIAPERARAFLFHAMMNNYVFLPLPLVLFLYGERGVALLVFSSIGYEFILWTIGVFLFTREASLRARLKELASPPLITLIASLAIVFVRDHFSLEWTGLAAALATSLVFVAEMLGQATVALSVIVAGSRFAVLQARTMRSGAVWVVTGLRLILVPMVLIPIILQLQLEETARGILLITAVMPSAMVSVLFSERYGGDSEFIAGGLLLTHLCALVTVPLFLAWLL